MKIVNHSMSKENLSIEVNLMSDIKHKNVTYYDICPYSNI